MINLTSSLEDYLETIFILQQSGEDVRITDIAKELKISKPSVNRAIKVLKEEFLVEQKRYGKIILTSLGKEKGGQVYTRHKILKSFFMDILGVSDRVSESDACKAEHILSEESINRIMEYTNLHKKD